MGLSLAPRHLARYRDIAWLLIKHGRRDVVRAAGMDEALATGDGDGPAEDALAPAAESLAADLEKLGPTFVKVGQFLSTRADLLPVPYLEALARLQDRVDPFPFEDVERIVSSELGVRLSKAFASFDHTPLAAASLGQVHRATLRDGRPVAVKVQRPDIRDRILEDLEAIGELAEFLDAHTEIGRRYAFGPMVVELRKALLGELDYRREARNLASLGENLAEFETIVVPAPVEDYVTSRVLTMDFVRGKKVTALSPLVRVELDGGRLADDLTRAYLQQVLADGFFHADPHPGNVFLTDDHRLALLDLGMVAHLTPRTQERLLKLLLAVSEGRGDEAAAEALRIATLREDSDEAEARRRIAELVSGIQGLSVADIQIGRVVLEITHIAADVRVGMPPELTLLGKTLLNVDQVAIALDPEFDPAAAVRRHAAELLRKRMRRRLRPGAMFGSVLEWSELLERLPARINRLVDSVSRNELRVRVQAIDEALLMVGLQKIANRITLGLVLSALIIGAALLMRIETPFRILGYPGLAIVFFLAAAFAGLVLVLNILFHDRREQDRPRSGPR